MISLARSQLKTEAAKQGTAAYDPYKYTNEHFEVMYKVFVEDKGLHIMQRWDQEDDEREEPLDDEA